MTLNQWSDQIPCVESRKIANQIADVMELVIAELMELVISPKDHGCCVT
jgi:hypothetical protein